MYVSHVSFTFCSARDVRETWLSRLCLAVRPCPIARNVLHIIVWYDDPWWLLIIFSGRTRQHDHKIILAICAIVGIMECVWGNTCFPVDGDGQYQCFSSLPVIWICRLWCFRAHIKLMPNEEPNQGGVCCVWLHAYYIPTSYSLSRNNSRVFVTSKKEHTIWYSLRVWPDTEWVLAILAHIGFCNYINKNALHLFTFCTMMPLLSSLVLLCATFDNCWLLEIFI